ncbi:extracellular solute-binding protein [Paenibacillus sp. sptzw28]|uniref:extracellular solute-binding protein n=1 Tax=Paenibacillus sp. sptzw28 TaxID=715179 RepID=UPI001C6DD53B|nr:extracellular solute-binding protein [Paenibacillus sp. sptzw28]QYR23979.1 extracellular solute-binding protein [Paenibacillus sp. sptzw28]
MKSRKKRVHLLLTGLTTLALLAGCGGNAGNGGTGAAGSENAGQADGTDSSKKGPVKITMIATLHTPEVPSDKIEKLLEEKTNTELDIQWVPQGSYDDKVNASFATGTLPMAVNTGLIFFRDAIRNGQFWEIGPYLEQFPNLKNLKPEVLKNTSVDGKIYSLYQERPLSRQGVIYRKDWADNLGLQAPKTIDDIYNMAKLFTEKDPDKNGANDTIGLADRNDMIYGAFKTVSSYFGTPNGWGEQDGKLMPEFMFPEYMDTMKFIQKLHKEGLINKDFPVTSKTDQRNLFISGKAGLYIGSLPDVVGLLEKAVEINPNAKMDVQNRIEGPKGVGIWSIPGYAAVVLFPKSSVKSEEQLKDVLAFYDKLMSPELANLMQYGIEGEHYTIKDGKVIPSTDTKLTEREVKPYAAVAIGGPRTIQMLESNYSTPEKAKAEELVKDNDNILINDPTAPLDSKTFNEQGTRLQEIIKDATYQFMLSSIDEAGFKAQVDRWLKEGGQQIIDEYNASYQKGN